MAISRCPRCSKIFDSESGVVCQSCVDAEENDYDRVREVLQDRPNLTAEQVSDETGVDLPCVMRMINQGLVANASQLKGVKCGMCGAPAISISKKLCQACLEKLNAKLNKAQSKLKLSDKKAPQVGQYLNARKAFEQKKRT